MQGGRPPHSSGYFGHGGQKLQQYNPPVAGSYGSYVGNPYMQQLGGMYSGGMPTGYPYVQPGQQGIGLAGVPYGGVYPSGPSLPLVDDGRGLGSDVQQPVGVVPSVLPSASPEDKEKSGRIDSGVAGQRLMGAVPPSDFSGASHEVEKSDEGKRVEPVSKGAIPEFDIEELMRRIGGQGIGGEVDKEGKNGQTRDEHGSGDQVKAEDEQRRSELAKKKAEEEMMRQKEEEVLERRRKELEAMQEKKKKAEAVIAVYRECREKYDGTMSRFILWLKSFFFKDAEDTMELLDRARKCNEKDLANVLQEFCDKSDFFRQKVGQRVKKEEQKQKTSK